MSGQRLDGCHKMAADLLAKLLAKGPMEVSNCKKECFAAGFSLRTIERAKKNLSLAWDFTIDEQGSRHYTWSLPSHTSDGGLEGSPTGEMLTQSDFLTSADWTSPPSSPPNQTDGGLVGGLPDMQQPDVIQDFPPTN